MFLARHPSLAKALPGGASEAPEAPEAPAPPEPVVPDPEPPAQVGGMGWRDLDQQDINRISTGYQQDINSDHPVSSLSL